MVSEMIGIIESLVFAVVAFSMVFFAVMVVSARDIVRAALSLILTMLAVAAVYIMLNAQFLGVVQVLVYIGAIGVLILFAVMLTKKSMGGDEDVN